MTFPIGARVKTVTTLYYLGDEIPKGTRGIVVWSSDNIMEVSWNETDIDFVIPSGLYVNTSHFALDANKCSRLRIKKGGGKFAHI